MVKKNQTKEKIPQTQVRTPKQPKKKNNNSRGRPRKNQEKPEKQVQTQTFDHNQQQYWFTVDETREIVQILAQKSQILFKCLSGQQANHLKNTLMSTNQPQVSFNNFKHSRQAFAEKATKLQTDLLKKLEKHLQITLIGQKDQMNYFFFGKNTYQGSQNFIINLLGPIIHQDFLGTLKELLESTNQSESSIQELKDIYEINRNKHFEGYQTESSIQNFQDLDLYDINRHKHFVSWALILAWGKEVRDHLTKLQQNDKSAKTIKVKPKDLMEQSDEILIRKEEELKLNIDHLIQKYQTEYIKEIDDLRNLLSQRFPQNGQ